MIRITLSVEFEVLNYVRFFKKIIYLLIMLSVVPQKIYGDIRNMNNKIVITKLNTIKTWTEK